MNGKSQNRVSLYKSECSPCSYIHGLQASSLYANPYDPPDKVLYNHLIRFGFRRSGDLVYRPDCGSCRRCVPVRLKVCDFNPGRRFKRILRSNQDISIKSVRPVLTDEYYRLYQRYLLSRHAGGSMESSSEQDFSNFLVSHWLDSRFIELRCEDTLMAVAVSDILQDGLSAVYTFFDPEHSNRSPGNLAILVQTELAREQALPYLYLGYWIRDCNKMSYKSDFQPLEYFAEDRWMDKEEFEELLRHQSDDSASAHQYV